MLAITTVTLDGATIANADVLADVTIRHGRTGYFDAPSPSTCQATMINVDRADTRAVRLGRRARRLTRPMAARSRRVSPATSPTPTSTATS